jgi:hypothetical protein
MRTRRSRRLHLLALAWSATWPVQPSLSLDGVYSFILGRETQAWFSWQSPFVSCLFHSFWIVKEALCGGEAHGLQHMKRKPRTTIDAYAILSHRPVHYALSTVPNVHWLNRAMPSVQTLSGSHVIYPLIMLTNHPLAI